MSGPDSGLAHGRSAALIVVNPTGNKARVPIKPVPFTIGRHAESHLVLRDNRASRNHARIVYESGDYYLEDLKSSHGTYVNSTRIERQKLYNSDRIEFGFPDSYTLIFSREEDEIQRLLTQFTASRSSNTGAAGNLARLRALVDVARALQNSLSTDDVLAEVVDAALAFTGFERGFLLLERGDQLQIAVARDREGHALHTAELKVPVAALRNALRRRRELLAMTFDPTDGMSGEATLADVESRTVVCVPLVRLRGNSSEETQMITSASDTVGVIYLDSRQTAVDLSHGSRELLQTLALEASTILENARLLAEERIKQRMEEELNVARQIQSSLLPKRMPQTGWFRATGSSLPSYQVGGDYYDVKQINADTWSVAVTDVSGKGVSSAILAALLQGALLASEGCVAIDQMMSRINHFLIERAEGEKYATVFYCTVDRTGLLQWANAGHVTPYLVRSGGKLERLETTGLPLGMLPVAEYEVRSLQLQPGEKVVAYSDGLSEAQNSEGKYFEAARMREMLQTHAGVGFEAFHRALIHEFEEFTNETVQTDDVTVVVFEFAPE